MKIMLNTDFSLMSQDEILKTEGGILNAINSMLYAADLYSYYKDTKYVTSYNETVIAAGRYDLVKPNPELPQYNGLYVFTR